MMELIFLLKTLPVPIPFHGILLPPLIVLILLLRLPETQRAALELKSLGHSLQDIADALGVSPSNAGVLVHRARQAMSRFLAPYLEERAG